MNRYIIFILSFALLTVAVPAMASTFTGTLSTPAISTGTQDNVVGVPKPTASPEPIGTYTSVQNVLLTAAGSDSIYYTTDGTDPSCSPTNGTKYTGKITLSSSKTIRAVACFGSVASPVAIFAYGINVPSPSGSNSGNTSTASGGNNSASGGSSVITTTPLKGDINGDGVGTRCRMYYLLRRVPTASTTRLMAQTHHARRLMAQSTLERLLFPVQKQFVRLLVLVRWLHLWRSSPMALMFRRRVAATAGILALLVVATIVLVVAVVL